MATQDTIIIGQLDDSQLHNSIKQLVQAVKANTTTMANSFDEAMTRMEQSMNKLSNAAKNFSSSGSARTSKNKAESDSVQRLATDYDALSIAIAKAQNIDWSKNRAGWMKMEQQAIQQVNDEYKKSVQVAKERQDALSRISEQARLSIQQSMNSPSRYNVRQDSEINQLRMALHGYESDLKRLEKANTAMQEQAWDRLSGKIWHAQMQIAKYRAEQERLRQMPAENAFEQKAIAQKFDILNQKIKEAQANIRQYEQQQEKVLSTNYTAVGQDQARQNIERTKQAIHQMAMEMENFYASEKHAAQAASELFAQYSKKRGMSTATYVDSEGKSREIQFRTEEQLKSQILRIEQQIASERNKQNQTGQQGAQIDRQQTAELQKQTQLREQLNKAMQMSVNQNGGAGTQYASLQDKLLAVQDALAKVRDTNIVSPEQIQRAEQMIEQLKSKILQVSAQMQQSQITGTKTQVGSKMQFKDYADLDAAIASVLNKQKQQIKIADEATASEKRLSESLKTLKQAYSALSTSDRQSDNGKNLADQIQRIQRAIREVQQQMQRPVSLKAALGLDENTISQIQYKLQQLANYRSGLDVNKQAGEINRVNQEYDRLNKKLQQTIGMNDKLSQSNNALSRSFNYMKNRLAFYFTVGASTAFIKNLIEIRTQYEMAEKTIGILIDSAEKGSQIFNQLSDMALKSPYTLIDMANAAKQLTAYDVAAKDVVDTVRRLGDISAAVGLPMERLTYAIGQIKAYGYLNARDARMFSNAGIPLIKQLAEHYTVLEGRLVTTADVYDRIKKKTIEYNDVMQVVNRMTDEGGKFFNFQAKMAGTLKVELANLNLAWNNMLNEIGKSEDGLLHGTLSSLKVMLRNWREIKNTVLSFVAAFGLVKVGAILLSWAINARTLGSQLAFAEATSYRFADRMRNLGTSLKTFFTSGRTWITMIVAIFVKLGADISSANQRIKEFNNDLREGAKEGFDKLNELINKYTEFYKIQKNESTGELSFIPKANVPTEDLKKHWEEISEEIQTTTATGAHLVSELILIDDLSERISKSLAMLAQIRDVKGVIANTSENEFLAKEGSFWNIFINKDIDGFIDHTQNAIRIYDQLVDEYGSFEKAQEYALNKHNENWEDAYHAIWMYNRELVGTQQTAISVAQKLAEIGWREGWNVNQQREALAQVTNKNTEGKELSPKEQLFAEMAMEEDYYHKMRGLYDQNIEYYRQRWANAIDEKQKNQYAADYNNAVASRDAWSQSFDQQNVLVNRFYSWLRQTHSSDIQAMFNGLTEEEIRHFNFSEPKFQEWARRCAESFSTQYDVSFKNLWNWIQVANTWEVHTKHFIDVIETRTTIVKEIQTQDQKVQQADDEIEELNRAVRLGIKTKQEVQRDLEAAEKRRKEAYDAGGRNRKKEAEAERKAASAANKAKSAANKKASAAAKYERQQIDEIAKALKNELTIIKDVQSNYEKLRKAGVSDVDALVAATDGFGGTLESINKTFKKFGINQYSMSDFSGKNTKQLLKTLKDQRDALIKTGKVKLTSLREIDEYISKLEIDAKVYDMEQITKPLDEALSKISSEYEIGVELAASPDFGNLIADNFGLNLDEYPKTAEQAIERIQDAVDDAIKKLNVGKKAEELIPDFDVLASDVEKWAKQAGRGIDNELFEKIKAAQTKAREIFKKDASDVMKAWEKLVEQYGNIEEKITKIHKDAEEERRIARLKNAGNDVFYAIDKKEREQEAEIRLKEFKGSPTWLVSTAELSGMTAGALDMLIKKIDDYKKTTKNLSPKAISEINKTLAKLRKEVASRNPFDFLANANERAQERAEVYAVKIAEVEDEIKWIKEHSKNGILNDKDEKRVNELTKLLKKLRKEQKDVSETTFEDILESISQKLQGWKDIMDGLKAIGDQLNNDTIKKIADAGSDLIGNFEAAAKGAETWGGWWGAIIGGLTDGIPKIMKWISGDNGITEKVKDSELVVKRLENAYKHLEKAIEKAYGTEKYLAQETANANKQAQLAQLEYQLQLELSRKKKNQDESKIEDLRGQIIDLKYEIAETIESITADLLGISSVGDAAEQLVSSMIDAFKKGEDYMATYEGTFEKMVENMIMKAIVGRIIGEHLQEIWDFVDTISARNRALAGADYQRQIDIVNDEIADIENDPDLGQENYNRLQQLYAKRRELQRQLDEARARAAEQDYITPEDVNEIRDMYNGWKDETKQKFQQYMDMFGITFGQESTASGLSALQQGIQSVTEDTAGAIEGYMNGVSQQVYLQTDLITQIRDVLVGGDADLQIATNAQMLLQLQQSYQVQMAIQTILVGWSNPAGNAVKVEML